MMSFTSNFLISPNMICVKAHQLSMAFTAVWIVLLLASVSVEGLGDSYNFSCDHTPTQHASILAKVISNLKQENYTIDKGHLVFNYSTAFVGNPSSPYGKYEFEKNRPFWKLNEKDAVVFFGCTPPPMKYFSLRSYVLTTFEHLKPAIVFASLGDSLNQLVINTTGNDKVDPFGKTTVVTSTADVETDSMIRKAFVKAGLSDSVINTDVIPSKLVKMGSGAFDDTFGVLFRVAVFENPNEVEAYINYTWPVLLLHPPQDQESNAFDTPPLKKRGTGDTEASYNTTLLELVTKINTTVMDKYKYSGVKEQMNAVYLEGRVCLQEHTNCLGDNRDAAYMNTTSTYQFKGHDDPSFFIVCGLNHVKTGKATYMNFALGSIESVDDTKFGDSAKQYAPDISNIDMFFAYKVARQCKGEEYCIEVPIDKIKPDDPFFFVSRAYLEPQTKVGPDNAELLMPYVLYYTP